MKYALDNEGYRIVVVNSGQQAQCPVCKSEVVGKKGEIKKKHWAHHRNKDCDSWYEPLTEWHLKWQNYFPEENREVIISENVKSHRADIQINYKENHDHEISCF